MKKAPRLISYCSWLCLGIFLAQCESSWQTVQVRNDAGVIVEEYQVDKKTEKKDGWYKKYSEDGTLMETGSFKSGKWDGTRTIFDLEGNREIEENYVNGAFEGTYRAFYPNGNIELVGSYVNNRMEGIWKRYYQGGQLMEEVEMQDNEENGPFKEYYENGHLKAEGNYLHGDYEHGLLLLYDEDGILKRKMNCDQGICHTVWKKE